MKVFYLIFGLLVPGSVISMEMETGQSRNKRASPDLIQLEPRTPAEIQVYLDEFNTPRRAEGASNMQFMTWSNELADFAKAHVSNCLLVLSANRSTPNYQNFGEQIVRYESSTDASAPLDNTFTSAFYIQHFFTQGKHYTYANQSCAAGQSCSLYLTAVWANTSKIGCAKAWCRRNSIPSKQTVLVSCNFAPAGNIINSTTGRVGVPYLKGPPCSACPSGDGCNNGLCTNPVRDAGCHEENPFFDGIGMNPCIDLNPCTNGSHNCMFPRGICYNTTLYDYVCNCSSGHREISGMCSKKFSFVQRTVKLFRDEFNNLNSPEALAFIEEFKRVEMPLFRITNIIRLLVTKLRRGSTIVEFEALVGPSSANVTHEELLIEINQAINSNTLNTTLLIGGPSAGLPNITAECSMTPSQEGIPPSTLQNSVLDSSLSCAENLIGIRFNVCNLTRSGIAADRIVIAGPGQDVLNVSVSCKPNFIRTSDGQTSATFLLFDILSCGVQAMMTEREIRLSYYVRSLPPVADSKKVQRYYNMMSVFNCTFNRTALVDTMIVPKIQKVSFANPAVSGQFQIVLNLFRDPYFSTKFQSVDGKTPTVKVSDYIYFKASIGLSGAVLQASQCWATPSNNPNDTLKYVVIKSGCPSTDDRAAINVVSNYQSMNVKAGFKSFVWVSTPTRSIYIHCTVSVCFSSVSNCTGPVCGGRKRRDLGYDKDPKIYSVGPVIIETPCDVPGVCDHQCSMDDQYQAVCSCYAGFALGPDGRTCRRSLDESSDQSVDFTDNAFTLVMVVLMLSAVGVLVFNSRNGKKIAVSKP